MWKNEADKGPWRSMDRAKSPIERVGLLKQEAGEIQKSGVQIPADPP